MIEYLINKMQNDNIQDVFNCLMVAKDANIILLKQAGIKKLKEKSQILTNSPIWDELVKNYPDILSEIMNDC